MIPKNFFPNLPHGFKITPICQICGDFYQVCGMDPNRFDAEVIRRTNATARNAFPVVFKLDNDNFLFLRDQIVDTFRKSKESSGLMKIGLRLRFTQLLITQFFQPMEPSNQ